MTKSEAIAKMKAGEKLTHRYFTDSEFITQNGNTIIDENGNKTSAFEFWRWRPQKAFETDWEIFKSK